MNSNSVLFSLKHFFLAFFLLTCTFVPYMQAQINPQCKNATLALNANGNGQLALADIDNGTTSVNPISYQFLYPSSTFDCSQVGVQTITMFVGDNTGNYASCNATVTVVDLHAPVVLCRDTSIVLNAQGTATLFPQFIAKNYADACGINSITVNRTGFSCNDLGSPQPVTLTVEDPNGNVASCLAQVSVLDIHAPTLICKNAPITLPAIGSYTLTPNEVVQQVSDNCTSLVHLSKSVFNCSNSSPGQETITVTAEDRSGNQTYCNATVQIASATGGGIIYVRANATGANNGTSWANAFTHLQDALNASSNCGGNPQIWVASGVYKPTFEFDADNSGSTEPREKTFYINREVQIYGGFAGIETALSQRNIATQPTILSGDIGTPGNVNDNTYHVMYLDARAGNGNITSQTVIDGFIIRDGKSEGAVAFHGGGGAMYLEGSWGTVCNPTIQNCHFTANRADGGGVMYNDAYNGGRCSPLLFNCLFNDNHATGPGGVMYNAGGTNGFSLPSVHHCTFYSNSAGFGGVMVNDDRDNGTAQPIICSSIMWQNGNTPIVHAEDIGTTIAYCIYDDGSQDNNVSLPAGVIGFGNKDLDPQFVNAGAGNFRLQQGSPAIDAAQTCQGFPLLPLDLGGNVRPQGAAADMGAYEGSGGGPCPNNSIMYVHAAATGNNNGSSWADAFTDLQDAIDAACPGGEIWVAQGTYKPSREFDADHSGGADQRERTFYLNKNIKLYGGFAVGATSRSQQNPYNQPTRLSGDLGQPGNVLDNAYHVMYLDARTSNGNITSATHIDGFYIEGGYANGTTFNSAAGAMYLEGSWGTECSPEISRCFIRQNFALYGGAMYNDAFNGGTCKPGISVCIFDENHATYSGGVMYNAGGTNGVCSPTIANCTFVQNASQFGSVMINDGIDNGTAHPTSTNDIYWRNFGTAISNGTNAQVLMTNSIFQDNNIDGNVVFPPGVSGSGNLDSDPLFVDLAAKNYRLLDCSPGINSGLTIGGMLPPDIAGVPRPQNGTLDRGAFELMGAPRSFPALAQQGCGSCGEIRLNICQWDTSIANLDLLITSANSTYEQGNSLRWYADNNGSQGAALNIPPIVDVRTPGTNYYWVSQYRGNCSGSNATRVRVRVKKAFSPTVNLPTLACGNIAQVDLAQYISDPRRKATGFAIFYKNPSLPNPFPSDTLAAVAGVAQGPLIVPVGSTSQVIYVKSIVPNGCGGLTVDTLVVPPRPSLNPIPTDTAVHGMSIPLSISGQHLTMVSVYEPIYNTTVTVQVTNNSVTLFLQLPNTTQTPINYNLTITPYNGNCAGTPITHVITVFPSVPRLGQSFADEALFTVFPNPTNGRVTVSRQATVGSWQWQLADLTGKTLRSGSMTEEQMQLDLERASGGHVPADGIVGGGLARCEAGCEGVITTQLL